MIRHVTFGYLISWWALVPYVFLIFVHLCHVFNYSIKSRHQFCTECLWTIKIELEGRQSLLKSLAVHLILVSVLRLTPPTEGLPWDDLRKILHGGQRIAKVHGGEEILPKASTPWIGCTNITDRQTTCTRTTTRHWTAVKAENAE